MGMGMNEAGDLVKLSAREAVALLRRREVSPTELIDAALARIAATDGAVNALPTLCGERARRAARAIESDRSPGEAKKWLAGLPIAVKEARGAIVLAKSNTPEFGAGANTYNEVFGETRNPWDTALTCGGSSGGSAAALAAGQVWLATGSDLGGSLRIPAGFCAVVGLRPSPGRVASGPRRRPFDTLSVEGPMGRTVGDAAMMLDAMCGRHAEDPLSLAAPTVSFEQAAAEPRLPRRIAFSPDLGISPVDPEVRAICTAAAGRLGGSGAVVEEACPDLLDAPAIFATLRAAGFAAEMAPLLEHHRDKLKPEVVWNIEQGLALGADDVGRAERARGALYHRTVAFFRRHDLLLCPAACVPPFDVKLRWLRSLEDVTFDSYVEWLRLTYAITLTACPAIALPCGFTGDGRPVGLQMVGRPGGDADLLAAAAAAESIFDLTRLLPLDPRPGEA
jgi:amidase